MTFMQCFCAGIGMLVLIPIVGAFSAVDTLQMENERLRALLRKHRINPNEPL